MSSTEQAPEPTMDEILASIRRIIADDEANSESRPEPVSKPAAAPSPEPERPQATPSRLVDDITQALRGPDEEQSAARPAEEDILDLTKDMVEPINPEPAPFQASTTRPEPLTAVREEQLAPSPSSRAKSSDARVEPRLWEDETSSSEDEKAAPSGEPQMREELRADLATREPRLTVMDRITELAAVATRTSGEEAERSLMGRSEPKIADPKESRAEDSKAGEKAAPAAFTPQAPVEPKSFPQQQPAEAKDKEAETTKAEVERAEVSNGAAKSLEECVREMLRPMIRDWLDKNMQQILEKAVREELAVQVREKRQHH